ncbi:MAG: hypothetical protein WC570_03800 [Patescibacteria group bacterium]
MENDDPGMVLFENFQIRRHFDEKKEKWYFSVVDVVRALIQQGDFQTARKYWNKLKERLSEEGSQSVTKCHQLKMLAGDGKYYKTDAELLFTALAEMSSRQIAEVDKADGLVENKDAGKKGGAIARNARKELEKRTGKKVVSGKNYLGDEERNKGLES